MRVMPPSLLCLASAGAAAVVALIMSACAGSEDSSDPVIDPDATPWDDGGLDSGLDAHDQDAKPPPSDADASLCTKDWCETDLPLLEGTDGGTVTLVDVFVPSETEAWAVSAEGHVLHWDGAKWSLVYSAGRPLFRIHGDHQGGIWASGAEGLLLHRAASAAFVPVPTGVAGNVGGICESTIDAAHPRNLWVVAGAGTILNWTGEVTGDGSPRWIVRPIADFEIADIECREARIWLAGSRLGRGELLFGDGEAAWQPVPGRDALDSRAPYLKVWAASRDSLWVSRSMSPNVFRSRKSATDEHLIWAEDFLFFQEPPRLPFSIWGTSADDVWILGQHGRVLHWDGSDYHITATVRDGLPFDRLTYAIAGSGPKSIWVVGAGVALRRNTAESKQ